MVVGGIDRHFSVPLWTKTGVSAQAEQQLWVKSFYFINENCVQKLVVQKVSGSKLGKCYLNKHYQKVGKSYQDKHYQPFVNQHKRYYPSHTRGTAYNTPQPGTTHCR